MGVALAACQWQDDPVEKVPQVLTSTAEPTRLQETVVVTHTTIPEQVRTQQQDDQDPDNDLVFNIECGEIFCQVPWTGTLKRPFETAFRTTIDPSYPYASTRGGSLDPHHGVEFPNGFGTPVLAAGAGEVVYVGTDEATVLGPYTGFYGNVVILKHPNKYENEAIFSLYAHLSAIDVDQGDQVSSGDKIGEVGASGAADGSHLHFEIRFFQNDYKHTLNPVLWFAPDQEPGSDQMAVLAGRILDRFGHPLNEFAFVLEKIGAEGDIEKSYYPMTYYPIGVNSHPLLDENFAVPDLPPGEYKLTLISGRIHSYNFTLQPGSLGFLALQLE